MSGKRLKDGKFGPVWTFEIDGKNYTYRQLSEKTGISIITLRARVRNGATGKEIIKDLRTPRKIKYNGKIYFNMKILMLKENLTKGQARYRLKKGEAEYVEEER